jgi:hypothetical protein
MAAHCLWLWFITRGSMLKVVHTTPSPTHVLATIFATLNYLSWGKRACEPRHPPLCRVV